MRHILCAVLLLAAVSVAQTPNNPPAGAPSLENQKVLWQKLDATIHDVDQQLDGVMGVAIEDLKTGDQFLLHENEVFAQASSIKITVLADLYLQVQQGKLKLTDLYTVQTSDLVPDSDIMGGLTAGVTRITLRDLATMMVAVSDNSATNVLIDRVGMDNKVLSTNKDSWIPRDLPAGVKIANKPGAIEAVRNDSGIVFVEGRPYVICVMTAFLANERDGEQAISKISLAAWRMFDRLSRASEYGRVVSPGNGAR
ncbi:MAG: serine hydrolase [Candidatus Sulfotelmatobacter sp.]